MKRLIALLLTLVMVFALCACAGGGAGAADETEQPTKVAEEPAEVVVDAIIKEPAQEETIEVTPEPTNEWILQTTVDEFGDITEDSELILRTPISGDFSNTATTSSELSGSVFLNPGTEKPFFVFRLLEYGDVPITYFSNDTLTLKFKIDDTIYEHELAGDDPTGDLLLGDDYEKLLNFNNGNYAMLPDGSGFDELATALYQGIDVRCIINIGSSQYNFTIESGNFAGLCDDIGFKPVLTLEEGTLRAITKLLTNDLLLEPYTIEHYNSGYTIVDACSYLAAHRDEYPKLSTNEIDEFITGKWLQITLTMGDGDTGSIYLMEYTEDGRIEKLGKYRQGINGSLSEDDDYNPKTYYWSVEDDMIYPTSKEGATSPHFSVSKLFDGCYLLSSYYLLISCDDNGIPLYSMAIE